MEGATTNRIKKQVEACPSGALSYFSNAKESKEEVTQTEETISMEASVTTTATVSDKSNDPQTPQKETPPVGFGRLTNLGRMDSCNLIGSHRIPPGLPAFSFFCRIMSDLCRA